MPDLLEQPPTMSFATSPERHIGPKRTPVSSHATYEVVYGQIQHLRLPQNICSQFHPQETASNRAIKLLHNTVPLCIDIFASTPQKEGQSCPLVSHTIRQSKRVVNKPLIVQWDITNGKANVQCQKPRHDSRNFQVMLDVSVIQLFSVALNRLQKSQSLNMSWLFWAQKHTFHQSRCLNYLSMERKAALLLGTWHIKDKNN